jgi:hypothetical protein
LRLTLHTLLDIVVVVVLRSQSVGVLVQGGLAYLLKYGMQIINGK